MIKLLGAIVLIITGVLTGKTASEKLSKRCKNLRALIMMTDKISTLIRYRSFTVYEIAENLKNDSSLFELSFLKYINYKNTEVSFEKVWCEALKKDKENFENCDFSEIKALGVELGKSDRDGQISSLALHRSNFEKYLIEAEAQKQTKGRLYQSLGTLAGVLLAILLI